MMQTVIDIRMMAEADISAVLEIQAVCYTEVTPESNESLHAKLSASQSTCFIASLEGDIVGSDFLALGVFESSRIECRDVSIAPFTRLSLFA